MAPSLANDGGRLLRLLFIQAGVVHATSPVVAVQSEIHGEDFPTGSVILVACITAVVALIISSLAMWKSEKVEHTTEETFNGMGKVLARHPKKWIAGSVFFVIVFQVLWRMLQEQELDPAQSWVPRGSIVLDHSDYVSDAFPSNLIVDVYLAYPPGGINGDNMITRERLQALHRDWKTLMAYEVDGDRIIEANKGNDEDEQAAQKYAGKWSFEGGANVGRLCHEFRTGVCATKTLLSVFNMDDTVIDALDQAQIEDRLQKFDSAPRNQPVATLPGVFKDFELTEVLGGITRNGAGNIVAASVLRSVIYLSEDMAEVVRFDGGQKQLQDPRMFLWEGNLVCQLGLEDEFPDDGEGPSPCPVPSGIEYIGQARRSFGDEFGNAIGNDIAKVAIAYALIIVYLFVNMGKRDTVHSMIFMSFGCLLVIGFAFVAANGLGGLFGVKVTPLNNNMPFLLVGLGVDDSFVLASEYMRHMVESPGLSIEERIARTARTGGLSVLVTSLTDALAFLIGATTVLPALSSFCIYAGIGVTFCFVFMMTVFLPFLTLNARRADNNYLDCCCCCKAGSEHKIEEPQGCCNLCTCGKEPLLPKALGAFGGVIAKTLPGRIVSLVLFFCVFCVGTVGLTQFEKDFKLEWFFPEDSYVSEYIELDEEYFQKGITFTVYGNNVDAFQQQDALNQVSPYLEAQSFVVSGTVTSFWQDFWASVPNRPVYTDEAALWTDLAAWFQTPLGMRYSNKVKWVDSTNPQLGIRHMKMAEAQLVRFQGDGSGRERYEVYWTIKDDIKALFGGDDMKAFPFHRDFLFWVEVGVIDSELIRNLIVAFGVVCSIVALLIPKPRIALIVAVNIGAIILEIMGFAHWWGITMNGIATIYFLICAGLSVDYSAHIAHAFNSSTGSSEERAVKALTRLGPSVWHAIFSTFLAVVVLAFSKSFVFEVFFKILFLVCFVAGAHGMWLLPCLLSIFGGNKPEETSKVADTPPDSIADANPVGKAAGA